MSETDSHDPRRHFERVEFVIKITLTDSSGEHHYERTRNVSMGGIFVETDKPLEVGSQGKMNITLECGEARKEIDGYYEIIRVNEDGDENEPAGMALEFAELSPEGSINLFNCIRYQRKD